METNSSDSHGNEADFIITTDSLNDVIDAAQSQNEKMKSDVSNRKEASEAARNENSDWIRPFITKIMENLCRICPKDRKTM